MGSWGSEWPICGDGRYSRILFFASASHAQLSCDVWDSWYQCVASSWWPLMWCYERSRAGIFPYRERILRMSACLHFGGIPELGREVMVRKAPVQSEWICAFPFRSVYVACRLCRMRCIASRPRSSPRKALADWDTSSTERVRQSCDSEHSIIIAVEQTLGWSSLMKDPSDTQTRVPCCVA